MRGSCPRVTYLENGLLGHSKLSGTEVVLAAGLGAGLTATGGAPAGVAVGAVGATAPWAVLSPPSEVPSSAFLGADRPENSEGAYDSASPTFHRSKLTRRRTWL